MCGIDGFVSAGRAVDARGYYAAHSLIRHRGPDDEGFVAEVEGNLEFLRGDDTIEYHASRRHIGEVASTRLVLGHRRLSIIDLTHCGHEPFTDPTGRYHLVFNGEIYNYIELRTELEAEGVSFVSQSDTEVLLQAWIRWGERAFDRFNGMWAFAIWDDAEQRLTLSRDRFGIKPLYYALDGSVLYFASEMKFIRAMLPATTIDADSARRYVRASLLNVDERTFWNEVRELQPGHWASFEHGRLEIRRYWNYVPRRESWAEADALARFAEIFEDSLRLRMRSDVEVGTLLSGGLDSTTIVCALDRLGLIGGGNFKSFSAVFEEEAFSEKRYLDLTLASVPVVPHLVYPKAEELPDYLPALLHHNEEPVRSLSVYSQYLIYETVKRDTQVKVVLNGQGADELFGGYLADYWVLMGAHLKAGRVTKALREARLLQEHRGVDWKTSLVSAAKNAVKALGHDDWFADAGFAQVRHSALREYLKYDDRNSAAFGIEARVPFLDYRMVEFAFSLDASFKISEFENKRIERAYARGLVPDEIVERKDKMGFVSPQEVWQRTVLAPEMERVLGSFRETEAADLVDDPRTEAAVDQYLKGDDREWGAAWRAYCLQRWIEASAR